MENPAISVIIPVYNAEEYVDRCIASVVNQSIENIEVLLIDDGSTDQSWDICKKWVARDQRIRLFRQKNAGVSAARNTGLYKCRGEYVMFLDSDDAYTCNACELMWRVLIEKQADCVVCGIRDTDGNRWLLPYEAMVDLTLAAFKIDFLNIYNQCNFLSPVWNKIYKRKLIVHEFKDGMAHGEDLCFALWYFAGCKRITIIAEDLYLHSTEKEDSLTHTFSPQRFQEIEYIQRNVLDFAPNDTQREQKLFSKYVRSAIHFLSMLECQYSISPREKDKIVNQWYKVSYMKKLDLSHFGLNFKDRFMMHMVRKRQFARFCTLLSFVRKIVK